MQRAPIKVESLLWDDQNEAKLAAHGVQAEDIEAVLANQPRFFVNLAGRSASHVMIGPDDRGTFYFAPIIPGPLEGQWYVVTAYRMNRRRALRFYELQ